MSTLTIEGWCKRSSEQKSMPVGDIHFDIQGTTHTSLEKAEERLQSSHEPETMLDVDIASLNLVMPEGYGPLADCKLRVYLDEDQRGQFHLVGHQASDGSLIYSNAVLIAQLS